MWRKCQDDGRCKDECTSLPLSFSLTTARSAWLVDKVVGRKGKSERGDAWWRTPAVIRSHRISNPPAARRVLSLTRPLLVVAWLTGTHHWNDAEAGDADDDDDEY